MPPRWKHVTCPISLVLLTMLVAGCDLTPLLFSGPGTSPSETLVVLAANATSADVQSGTGAGSDFARAKRMDLPTFGKVVVSGELSDISDVDVYSMGPVSAGDLLVVDVRSNGVDLRAALFDENQWLLTMNDDRNYYAGLRDPYVRAVIRRSTSTVYVAVAAARSATMAAGADGGYSMTITRGGGVDVANATPQTVWLEFGGGSDIRLAGEKPQNVPPLNMGKIGIAHESGRDAIVDRFVALMRADYAPYNVTLLRSDRDTRPSGPYSTLYFGGFSSVYLGLADGVDYYNTNASQAAIIYTETLSLFEALRPTNDQVAQAIANVAAHELGHLLGLEHTYDPADLMAEAGSAKQVLDLDATFMITPLSRGVFPIGLENSPMKIVQAVGLRDSSITLDAFVESQAAAATKSDTSSRLKSDDDDDVPLEWLGLRICNHRDELP